MILTQGDLWAVQLHPAGAVTVTLPNPPVFVKVLRSGLIPVTHDELLELELLELVELELLELVELELVELELLEMLELLELELPELLELPPEPLELLELPLELDPPPENRGIGPPSAAIGESASLHAIIPSPASDAPDRSSRNSRRFPAPFAMRSNGDCSAD
ncbi:MAG TPA: hypothetical protein VHM24_07780 [Gemmatimonadaceae bacterium]|nr:hypothetical protein [Gemmatimonadaceae bacterium]